MTSEDRKLSDLILGRDSKPFLSIEFFPPKTNNGVLLLDKVIDELKEIKPLFLDVTWGAGGSTSELTFDICKNIKEKHQLTTNIHITCTNMKIETIDDTLKKMQQIGIKNLLALRGDPPVGQEWIAMEGGLTCALDLINYIKNKFNDYFHISCACYPEGHPLSMTIKSYDDMSQDEKTRCYEEINEDGSKTYYVCTDENYAKEMEYLKQKVDAGASAIITQMFFDTSVFKYFVKKCREYEINVPIIPGIMLIQNYAGFKRMIKFCKTRVPTVVLEKVESLKDDEEKFKKYGIDFGIEMSNDLLLQGAVGLHFYTLNQSAATLKIASALFESTPVLLN